MLHPSSQRYTSAMTIVELIRAFAHEPAVAVVLTDATVNPPDQVIQYANQAFAQLTGTALSDLVGVRPHFMRRRETHRALIDKFSSALSAGQRFHPSAPLLGPHSAQIRPWTRLCSDDAWLDRFVLGLGLHSASPAFIQESAKTRRRCRRRTRVIREARRRSRSE